MPAKSKKQQMAAGAALAAKRGKRSKKWLPSGRPVTVNFVIAYTVGVQRWPSVS